MLEKAQFGFLFLYFQSENNFHFSLKIVKIAKNEKFFQNKENFH